MGRTRRHPVRAGRVLRRHGRGLVAALGQPRPRGHLGPRRPLGEAAQGTRLARRRDASQRPGVRHRHRVRDAAATAAGSARSSPPPRRGCSTPSAPAPGSTSGSTCARSLSRAVGRPACGHAPPRGTRSLSALGPSSSPAGRCRPLPCSSVRAWATPTSAGTFGCTRRPRSGRRTTPRSGPGRAASRPATAPSTRTSTVTATA